MPLPKVNEEQLASGVGRRSESWQGTVSFQKLRAIWKGQPWRVIPFSRTHPSRSFRYLSPGIRGPGPTRWQKTYRTISDLKNLNTEHKKGKTKSMNFPGFVSAAVVKYSDKQKLSGHRLILLASQILVHPYGEGKMAEPETADRRSSSKGREKWTCARLGLS